MATLQWIIAAITAGFVALVGYLQWRTAQNKAVLDLFERRREIYNAVRKAVAQIVTNSTGFDQSKEIEFIDAMERAYFFFGDDVQMYLKGLWDDINNVCFADRELSIITDPEQRKRTWDKRVDAFKHIQQFYTVGQPLFARYMRFTQTVPRSWWSRLWHL